jgi:hypothetical protein
MLKGITLIFLAPYILLASLVSALFGLVILGALTNEKHYASRAEMVFSQHPKAQSPQVGKASAAPTVWPDTLRSDPPFCAWLGTFAATTVQRRDTGDHYMTVLRSLDEGPRGRLYAVMAAIIADVYTNINLTPSMAQRTTETLCLQQNAHRS